MVAPVVEDVDLLNIAGHSLAEWMPKLRMAMAAHAPLPYGTWRSYVGISSILLAVVLVIVVGALLFLAMRLDHPIVFKRPGTLLVVAFVVLWVLSLIAFLAAIIVYVRTLYQQVGHFTGPVNPVTPVTVASGVVAFIAIAFLARGSGLRGALVSAIVGTIAAPMIFELPFDLIVMWRTYPPAPAIPFTLLFFVPLFFVEILSFAMLTFSPVAKLSRYTLCCLAGMFLLFAIWALFDFVYPATPIPIALNMLAKIMAFATAISLFLPLDNVKRSALLA